VATPPTWTEPMTVHASDMSWMLTRPTVSAYASSNQSFTTGTTALVALNAHPDEYAAIDTMHDGTGGTYPNSRVVFVTAGLYIVLAHQLWATQSGGNRLIDLRKNAGGSASGGTRIGHDARAPASGGVCTNTIVTLEAFNANDYVEMFAVQDSGSTVATVATNYSGAVGIQAFMIAVHP
jgi:hypothetical protein